MAKKRLAKIEKNESVREPRNKPNCPLHQVVMEFDPLRGVWACPWDDCTQIAFPPEVAEKGRPVIVSGELELVHAPDPGGDKRGRWLLRSATGTSNTMIDVTDHLDDYTVEVSGPSFTVTIVLKMRHMTEVK